MYVDELPDSFVARARESELSGDLAETATRLRDRLAGVVESLESPQDSGINPWRELHIREVLGSTARKCADISTFSLVTKCHLATTSARPTLTPGRRP
jgi:hypothetical protein